MTNPKLDGLIARVAAATGPDRALDAEIAVAAGWTFHEDPLFDFWRAPDDEEHGEPLAFTASVDAALTLLPEGVTFQIGRPSPDEPYAIVGSGYVVVKGRTLALALCVAVLKARTP